MVKICSSLVFCTLKKRNGPNNSVKRACKINTWWCLPSADSWQVNLGSTDFTGRWGTFGTIYQMWKCFQTADEFLPKRFCSCPFSRYQALMPSRGHCQSGYMHSHSLHSLCMYCQQQPHGQVSLIIMTTIIIQVLYSSPSTTAAQSTLQFITYNNTNYRN